jgi:uncharacterized membrane protein
VGKNLVILGFQGTDTAQGVLELIEDLQKQGVVRIEDAVVAYREADGGAAKVHQSDSLVDKGAKRGAAGGLLAGLLLGGPIVGLIAGVSVGAIAGSLKDHGIDDHFVENVVRGLQPDRSALFLLGEATDEERLRESLKPYKARVLQTTLSEEQEAKLRKALAEEEYRSQG